MTDNQNPTPNPTGEEQVRKFTEELEVAGNQLVDRVKELVQQSNVRRLIIRNEEGRTLLEIPLTGGLVAGAALVFLYPMFAGLAAIGALAARLKIEIVRDEASVVNQMKSKVEGAVDDIADDVEEFVDDIDQPRG